MINPRSAIFILLFSSAILLFLSGSTWIRRKNAGSPAKWLSLCMTGAAVYCFGYAMELSSDTLAEMMSWIRFQHLGIQVLAPYMAPLFPSYIRETEPYHDPQANYFPFDPPVPFLFCPDPWGPQPVSPVSEN